MKRIHTEPLPGTMGLVLMYVQRALSQQNVQELSITPKGIIVTREMVEENSPVVPPGTDDVDVPFILDRIDITPYPFKADEHSVYALYGATKLMADKKRMVFAVVAPGWSLFSAWLGVETTKEPPFSNFGMRTLYVDPLITNERVVLLGAKSNSMFLSDVDCGVAIDLGV